jgi:hypothetical protein
MSPAAGGAVGLRNDPLDPEPTAGCQRRQRRQGEFAGRGEEDFQRSRWRWVGHD